MEYLEFKRENGITFRRIQHNCDQVTCPICEQDLYMWVVNIEPSEYWMIAGVSKPHNLGEDGFDPRIDEFFSHGERAVKTTQKLATILGPKWEDIEEDTPGVTDFLASCLEKMNPKNVQFYDQFMGAIENLEEDKVYKFRRLPDDNPGQAIDRVRVMLAFPKFEKAIP